jgi:hypothetical protein
MSSRTILLSVHITAIASWLGADVLQHAMRHRWAKETPDAATAWARMVFWLHDRYYAVVAVVILGSGIALVQDEHWAWSSTFIWVGVATILAGATLGGIGLKGSAKKRVAALEANDMDAATAIERRWRPIELLLTALVIITVVSMVHKWGA